MEITKADIQTVQTDGKDSELVLKDGEKITLNFVRKLEAGMFVVNVKGRTIAAELNFEPTASTSSSSSNQYTGSFPAQVIKTDQGVQLKIFPPLIEQAETTINQPTSQQTTNQQSNSQQTSQQTTEQTVPKAPIQIPENATATLKPADIKVIVRQMTDQPAQSGSVTTSPQTQDIKQQYSPTMIKQAEAVISADGKTEAIKLPAGAIQTEDGETVSINIIKMQDNGKTLISVKDTLFEIKLDPQVLKTLTASTLKLPQGAGIELALMRQPVENLNPGYVKQQVSGFDIDNFLKAFGKFSKVNMEELTPKELKAALKNSGLSFENKLSNGDNVSADEKLKAYMNTDTTAKDSITRLQVTNLMMAGGLFAFLKTKDENVGDTVMRYKRGKNGNDTIYVSTEFSELGETLIIIKPTAGDYNITIKTEKDISEELANLKLEKGLVHWYKFNKQDLELMDPRKDISQGLGTFEVII